MKKTIYTSIPILLIMLCAFSIQGSMPTSEMEPFVPESCKVKLCTTPSVSGHTILVKNSSGVVVASCVTQADGCCSAEGNFNCLETHYAYDYTLDCYYPVNFIPRDVSVVYVTSNCP